MVVGAFNTQRLEPRVPKMSDRADALVFFKDLKNAREHVYTDPFVCEDLAEFENDPFTIALADGDPEKDYRRVYFSQRLGDFLKSRKSFDTFHNIGGIYQGMLFRTTGNDFETLLKETQIALKADVAALSAS